LVSYYQRKLIVGGSQEPPSLFVLTNSANKEAMGERDCTPE